jgi:TetR/AcrR family transcriptional regulator, copper-responsive repressor
MVQKKSNLAPQPAPRPRGRPRAYQPELALTQALAAFWRNGFAATSLDDLRAATGMNRPSLYGAFGDKRALYLKAYQRYRAEVRETFGPIFRARQPLRKKLRRILIAALDLYSSGEMGPRGCFTVLTASSNLIDDPEMRALVLEALARTDKAFEELFRAAAAAGELSSEADPAHRAQMASATIHTLAIRARVGAPRARLERLIDNAVATLCPGESVR